MKLTKSKLRSIIKEEISSIIEGPLDGPTRKDPVPPSGPPPDNPLLGATRKDPEPPPPPPPPGKPGAMALIVKELEALIKKIKAAM